MMMSEQSGISKATISPATAEANPKTEITDADIDKKFDELTELRKQPAYPGQEERIKALSKELNAMEAEKREQDDRREEEIQKTMSCQRRVCNRIMCISEGIAFVACFGWLFWMCKKA